MIATSCGQSKGETALSSESEKIVDQQANPQNSSQKTVNIGVFYFPGWSSDSKNWDDLKGTADSKSPNQSWPERVPLLGYYPEEETWVAEQHIEWASEYGINFFAYDWYWGGSEPYLEHALRAYLQAYNKSKLKFCILWANHSNVPRTDQEFENMVLYWIDNYFRENTYFTIDSKPVVFIYSPTTLDSNAEQFNESGKSLLDKANTISIEHGLSGIYFIAVTNSEPSDTIEQKYTQEGYNAYTGWNYAVAKDTSKTADYSSMVQTYLDFYNSASTTEHILPYIPTASPGWDSRPWDGDSAYVRLDPTPEKFETMLRGAKDLTGQDSIPDILMIESWNEFCEGSYIEPTVQWDFSYLEIISKIFRAP